MKIKLLFTVSVLYCLTVFSQTVVTNDFAFESYLETLAEAQGQGNVANNNEVIFSDLSTITTISAPSLGIVDLTGLERFTALTLLELQNNNITTLVRAEGLTLLQTLRAFNCDIQGLVDFSLLVNLGVVGLDDNQISSITLPTSASLGILDIRNSSLSALDLTNKPNITQLAVSGNQLTFLDISVIDDLQQFRTCDNVGLSCIQVTQTQFDNLAAITSSLTCPSNGTPNNNVGGWLFDDTITQFGTNPTCVTCTLTPIADLAFETFLESAPDGTRLDLNGVDVTSISDGIAGNGFVCLEAITQIVTMNASGEDVQSNTPPGLGITSLSEIAVFTDLEFLRVEGNDLITINLGQNFLLKEAYVYNNQLISIELGNLNLEALGVTNNNLIQVDISSSTDIQKLDIENNPNFTSLILPTSSSGQLNRLFLNDIDLTDLDISGVDQNLTNFRILNNDNLGCIKVSNEQTAITRTNASQYQIPNDDTSVFRESNCSNGVVVVTNDFAFESYLETLAEAQGQGNVANNNEVIFSDLSTITTISAPSLGIVDLTGLERFTALTLLELQNNNITTLVRAEGLTLLQILRAFNCDIQGLVDFSLLVNLGVVGLDDNQISSITLPTSASLGILDIRNSSLSALDLTNKPNITQLAVSGNQLTFLDISVIDDLQQFRTCDNVGLSCIQVTQTQFDNLAAITSSLTCPSNGTPNNNVGGWLFDDTITQFGTNPTCTSIEVTIVATDSDAFENPLDNGEFEVRLNQVNTTGEDIIINYMVAGSAMPNQDYQTLTGTVAIANGESINVIPVIPIDDPESEGIETIEVTLTADMAYGVGIPNTAIVNITSEDTVSNEGPNLGPNDISVMVLSNSCPGVANGSILVTTQQNLNFNILFDNNQVGTLSSSASFLRENLAQGTYDVCLTLAEFQNWERCFTVVVEGLSELNLVGFKVIEASKVANLKVAGSKTYVVNVNGKQYNFNSLGGALGTTSIQIPIKVGLNDISVRGESQCQGVLGQKLFLGDLRAYPNPVVDNLQIVGLENNEEVNLIITNLAGQVIFNGNDKSINGKINIDFTTMNSGVYLIFYESATMAKQFKILKR